MTDAFTACTWGGLVSSIFSTATIDKALLYVLSASGLLLVLDAVGWLGSRPSRWINRNSAKRTLDVLKELGVDIPTHRRMNASAALRANVSGTTLADRVGRTIEPTRIKKSLLIGSMRPTPATSYLDVMGATTSHSTSVALARDLVAHWNNVLRNQHDAIEPMFDFVVTPKAGSPILGYEFAQLVQRPFVAYNSEPKFQTDEPDFRAEFDTLTVPPQGARALVVDDSSTGGSKAIALVEALRRYGYEVSDFLMLFEPGLKIAEAANAAARLGSFNVRVHSILKT